MPSQPEVSRWFLPTQRRLCVALVVCFAWLGMGCPSPEPPGGKTPDFCQSNDNCAAGSTCLNSICVVKTIKGDKEPNPWSKVPASECAKGETRSCKSGKPGACEIGKQTCVSVGQGWKWGDCSTEPSQEVCNGVDDDCNGPIDETFPDKGKECTPAIPRGPCGKSAWVCRGGKRICPQLVTPKREICNGIDDDCNGKVDETFPTKGQSCDVRGTKGPCVSGSFACRNRRIFCLQKTQPSKEKCDGADNDCDGEVDENCDCRPGQMQDCFTGPKEKAGVGICKRGKQLCGANGKWLDECRGEVLSQTEICDGKDNDCDGNVDNFKAECYGDPPKAFPPGAPRPKGLCKTGIRLCQRSRWQKCEGQVLSQKELCNNKDDDCDGNIDNSFPNLNMTCWVGSGECKSKGTFVCSSDEKTTVCNAKPTPPSVEICDNKDNDCDGLIDEGVTQSCYTGPAGTVGIGVCKSGTQKCTAGVWGACSGEQKPKPEVCDGKDNDCNKQTDEGLPRCECTPGTTGVCYTGPSGTQQNAPCKPGKRFCDKAGRWGRCNGEIKPSKETCDGKDNDCNGLIDDMKPRECFAANRKECRYLNGSQGTDQQMAACVRPCAPGTQTCSNGTWGACTGEVLPTDEYCDGKDTDCDGQIDNSFPDDGKPCKTGQAGVCDQGLFRCVNGTQVCVRQTAPKSETCDGKDNNCDGQIDNHPQGNGNPCQVTGAKGVCGDGKIQCTNGTQVCVGPKASNEVCDGKDNDCDGQTDEICGAKHNYIVAVPMNPQTRGFKLVGGAVNTQATDFERQTSDTDPCSKEVLIVTTHSSFPSVATYTCGRKKFTIRRFRENVGSRTLQKSSAPFHALSPVSGTYGRVDCGPGPNFYCNLAVFSDNSVTYDSRFISEGIIKLNSDYCKTEPGGKLKPFFATLFGADGGFIQTWTAGTINIGRPNETGKCEIQTYDASGRPRPRSFSFWFPPKASAVWAKVVPTSSIASTIDLEVMKFNPEFVNPWLLTDDLVGGMHTQVAHDAWMSPSVVITSPLFQGFSSAKPPLTTSIDTSGVNSGYQIKVHSYEKSGLLYTRKKLPYAILYGRR